MGSLGGGSNRAQPRNNADLKAEERHQLRQHNNASGAPARIQQALQPNLRGIARMQHQQMRLLQRGRKPIPQHGANLRCHPVNQPGAILNRQPALREMPIGASCPRRHSLLQNHHRNPARIAAFQHRAVMRERFRLIMQHGNKRRDRVTFQQRNCTSLNRMQQQLIAEFGLRSRLTPRGETGVQL